jgi:hypothetical protein
MKKLMIVLLMTSLIFATSGISGTNSYAGMMNSSQNNGYFHGGMMGGAYGQNTNLSNNTGDKLDLSVLKQNVEQYISNYNEELMIGDIFIYEDTDYYFSIMESDTGRGAMELLVNPYTGNVYPEFGPNMMWNLKYSMMGTGSMMGLGNSSYFGNMMGNGNNSNYDNKLNVDHSAYFDNMMGFGSNYLFGNMMGFSNRWANMQSYGFGNNLLDEKYLSTDSTLTLDDAKVFAEKYIASIYSDDYTIENDAHSFYGYYTFHLDKDGTTAGMLSVNGLTGTVWFHTWQGTLIDTVEND